MNARLGFAFLLLTLLLMTGAASAAPSAQAPPLTAVLAAGSSAGNTRIADVAAPVAPGDAANKAYVDASTKIATREVTAGHATAIADGVRAKLPLDLPMQGSSILNASNPLEPFLSSPSGIYATTVWVSPREDLTPGGSYQVYLSYDVYDEEVFVKQTSSPASVTDPRPQVTIPLTYFLAKGAVVHVVVTNNDGAETRTFAVEAAAIQRIN